MFRKISEIVFDIDNISILAQPVLERKRAIRSHKGEGNVTSFYVHCSYSTFVCSYSHISINLKYIFEEYINSIIIRPDRNHNNRQFVNPTSGNL